ncbi:MAG: hypothetical protein ACXV5Q_06940 [Frankiaceae bacterium]
MSPSGIPSTLPDGRAPLTADGEPIMAQRGELLCCKTWKHAGLLIENKSVLSISEQDWEGAATCSHGARWADEDLARGCSCEPPGKITTL